MVYTDGSAMPNPGPCGAGAFLCFPHGFPSDLPRYLSTALGSTDNGTGEIWAIGMVAQLLLDSGRIPTPPGG